MNNRISGRLESLTTSLIAWKQFESGMTEFKEALGKDKGTLKGLTGALEMCGDDNEHSLEHDVKEVAKRLSERSESNIQQVSKLFLFFFIFFSFSFRFRMIFRLSDWGIGFCWILAM